jgi:hypothetical protein
MIALASVIIAASLAIALRREQQAHWATRALRRGALEENNRLKRQLSTTQAERDWFKQAAEVRGRQKEQSK